ncbi:MAG: amino acid adenylation domain-containing protein [Bacteroidota bacterium]
MTATHPAFETSPLQRQVWARAPRGAVVTEAVVRGCSDPERVLDALRLLCGEHEILRTVVSQGPGGEVVQVVYLADESARGEIAVDYQDVRDAAPEAQAASFRATRQALAQSPAEPGPTLRGVLFHIDEDELRLMLALPATCADVPTVHLVLRGVAEHCGEGYTSSTPLQYADVAAWQNDGLANAREERPPTQDPAPHPLAASGNGQPRWCWTKLPGLDASAVQAVADREGVSPHLVMLAAYQVVLERRGIAPSAIGYHLDGRDVEGLAETAGRLAHWVSIAPASNAEHSFGEVLRSTRSHVDAHRERPWTDRLIQQEQRAAESYAFATTQALWSSGEARVELVGVHDSSGGARFTLYVTEAEGTLGALVAYDAAQIGDQDASDLAHSIVACLDEAVQNPTTPATHWTVLGAPERARVTSEWNATEHAFPDSRLLPERIWSRAQATPDAVAVTYDGHVLNYGQLAARASQIARELRSHGVGRDVRVGVCLERSLDLVASLVGIWWAGGAYVPIDPALPRTRRRLMVEDAAPEVLITTAALAPDQPAQSAHVLIVDELEPEVGQALSEPALIADTLPSQAAYVIFTSGSTGRPKGVVCTHAGICNRLDWMQAALPLTEDDIVLQKTPFGFDVSVWEFFWPLFVGVPMVVARPGGHEDPAYLAALIEQAQVTTMHFVPSMLSLFLEEVEEGRCSSLRQVVASGEALAPAHVRQFYERLPSATLHNLYGPTEASVDVTWWMCHGDEDTVPIGRPVSNTSTYVVDERGRLVPSGAEGELMLGGVQLARGYEGRPRLTASRFIPDAFGGKPGGRLYRTGDRARWRTDGALEFMGRLDFQVKLNGQRVELAEIEAVLVEHPGVQAAAVVVREGPSGALGLVAYAVPTAGQPLPSTETLRGFLAGYLPNHMVPPFIVALEAMPLTPNGKLNRNALPDPEVGAAYVAPASDAEQKLVEIWELLLKRQPIGVDDNFFELGGDSIIGIQFVARARAVGLELAPRELFEHQTIAELASVARLAGPQLDSLREVSGPFPLTPIQRWFFDYDFAEPHHWNQVVLLTLAAGIDMRALGHAVDGLYRRHDALRLRFSPAPDAPGEWQQQVAAETGPTLTMLDLSAVPPALRSGALEQAAEQTQGSLHITEGPVCRVVYAHYGAATPGRLLLVAHHLVVDGVSWTALLEDLHLLYEAARNGEQASLPPVLPFSAWVNVAQQEQDAALQPAHPWPELGEAGTEGTGATITRELSEETTQLLLERIPSLARRPLDEVLIAALATTLRPTLRQGPLDIDVERHGRDSDIGADLTRTVGWFTALQTVRLDTSRATSLGSALGALELLDERRSGAPILFNYLGVIDRVGVESTFFGGATESMGRVRNLANKRTHPHIFDVMVVGGKLVVQWRFNRDIQGEDYVSVMVNDYINELRRVAHEATFEDISDINEKNPWYKVSTSLESEGQEDDWADLLDVLNAPLDHD